MIQNQKHARHLKTLKP